MENKFRELGRLGGRKRSAAKRAASVANGKRAAALRRMSKIPNSCPSTEATPAPPASQECADRASPRSASVKRLRTGS